MYCTLDVGKGPGTKQQENAPHPPTGITHTSVGTTPTFTYVHVSGCKRRVFFITGGSESLVTQKGSF
jgi:hypothetical protein